MEMAYLAFTFNLHDIHDSTLFRFEKTLPLILRKYKVKTKLKNGLN